MNEAATTPFDSEASYRAAIDVVLAGAQDEIRIFDQDLLQMQLESRERVARLVAFLTGGERRRLRIVVHDTGPIEQRMPRLIEMIRLHGHLIETRRTPDHLRHLADRWVLADGRHGTIRFHADHARGKLVTHMPDDIAPWWRRSEDLWGECEPCSPGATVGL
jgi:hypothetical protein